MSVMKKNIRQFLGWWLYGYLLVFVLCLVGVTEWRIFLLLPLHAGALVIALFNVVLRRLLHLD